MECPQPGRRVLVPLQTKEVVGIVYRCGTADNSDTATAARIKPVICLLDKESVITHGQLALWQWIAEYYMCPLGDVMSAALPSLAANRLYSLEETPARKVRLPVYSGAVREPHPLTEAQQRAADSIVEQWKNKQVVLFQGVTSSGKTEVYIRLIEKQLQQGKQVLYLVPEIALTTQLTERLQCVFGNRLCVYHSRVSDVRKMELYRRLLTDDRDCPQVIVGARSAVFLPFHHLGLVIVDEEHENSYKQQDPAPRYHARSVAIVLAQLAGAHVLLGTATPSVESRFNAEQGKYGHVTLNERYKGLQLPAITLIDLERQYHRKEITGHFSDPLVRRMREELDKHKQIILFQNRRGYAPYIQCTSCGAVPKCPNCDISLTLHAGIHRLVCHSCGYGRDADAVCTECGGEMKPHGFGTERLEDEVQTLFPNARIQRMDWDTTRSKTAYQTIIDRFAAHEVDILIGTQMVTKGLHFDDVSLVAVLNADPLFNRPDFRSCEHAFQMLEQVAGRAGRKGEQGEVMIQTFDAGHPIFGYLRRHDVEGMFRQQIEERRQFNYPPFCRQIAILVKHHDAAYADHAACLLQQQLVRTFGTRCSAVIVPLVARVQNQHIRRITIRIEANANIRQAKEMILQHICWLKNLKEGRNAMILPDVDPQ